MIALLGVTATTTALWVARQFLTSASLLLWYVPLVLLIAIWLGRSAAMIASIAAFLAYNFFFVPPLYTLTVERSQDLIELLIFLGISLLVGTLADRQRMLAATATQRAAHMTTLYELSRRISAATDIDSILIAVATTLQSITHATGIELRLDAQGEQQGHIQQLGSLHGSPIFVQPIGTETTMLGELRLWNVARDLEADHEIKALIATIANHTATVIERRRTVAAVVQAKALHEADRLKSALLSSISHDLRTPLAVIKGAASNLLDDTVRWDAPTQRTFAATIVSEADLLNRLMRNLFEMSRLEAGTLQRQRVLVDIGDIIGPTVTRLRPVLADHPIFVQIAPDLPAAPMDAVQIELVLSNLLENAAKFAPSHTPITVTAKVGDGDLVISVADRGSGVAPGDRERIFEKFFRAAAPEQGPGGTGLGLAICQGIVEAHGGRIWVDDHAGGGAIFRFTLPIDPTTMTQDPSQAGAARP